MKSTPGRIKQACLEIYGEIEDVVVPRLVHQLKAPHRVAAKLDVNANAVRSWLINRGWVFDPESGEWIEPEKEQPHA